MTKLSVFTPTHNPKYLQDLYECLKEQTYTNWEWIINYNNGAVPIGFNDSRVREITFPFVNDPCIGAVKRSACEKATGEILVEVDHDDLITPDALEEIAKAFVDEDIGFAYSNAARVDADFNPTLHFNEAFGWKYRPFIYKGHELEECIAFPPTPESMSRVWFAPDHVRAFRKSVYDYVGGHNYTMRVLDDTDLICRMYLHTKFKHIDKCLYIYRVFGDNSWLVRNKEIQDNAYKIHDFYFDALMERSADLRGLACIELGNHKPSRADYKTVDLFDADFVHDLNNPWPFPDSSIGVLRCIDVVEHLRDPIFFMSEAYRVLAPGGALCIRVPSTDGRGAFQDPTHKSFWNENSFLYYTHKDYAKYINTPVRFQAVRVFTTAKDKLQNCWVVAHLISLKDGYRPCGEVLI